MFRKVINYLLSIILFGLFSIFDIAGESFSGTEQQKNNGKSCQHYFFLLLSSASLPLEVLLIFMWSTYFTWTNHSWAPSHSSTCAPQHLHGLILGVCTGSSQTAIPPPCGRAGSRERRGRIILACSLTNRSGYNFFLSGWFSWNPNIQWEHSHVG